MEAFRLEAIGESTEADEAKPISPLKGYTVVSQTELSKAPGLAHLRFALTTDSNFDWNDQPENIGPWNWAFRFGGGDGEVLVLFNEDFDTLGKLTEESKSVEVVSCRPMAETLRDYFLAKKANLPAEPNADASNSAE